MEILNCKWREFIYAPELLGILFLAVSCGRQSSSRETIEPNDAGTSQVSELVWSDEFEYEGRPDSTKWMYDLEDGCQIHQGLCGWGNEELEYYTKRPQNVRAEDGKLIIEARKENMGTREYTSARVKTRSLGDWKYGRIEVKAKLPAGTGTWPAIWMLPTLERPMSWPADGEIDIMEHVGFDPGRIHGTIHTKAYNHNIGTQKSGQIMIEDVDKTFHVYSIEWNPDSISWFVDSRKYFVFTNEDNDPDKWPFSNPFHLIMNIAVGGSWGGQQGVDDSIWPQKMEVDWVRVYQ